MTYDVQGRMAKIVIESFVNGVQSQMATQTYTYDSDGIKIRQTETAEGGGTRDSVYLNDKQNNTGYSQVLEERVVENGREVKITTYTIGHDVLAQFTTAIGYLALLTDGHGSTRAVTDKRGGVVQQYSYDAYGNALGFKPTDALTNLLYSGEQFNPVSGLQYLRARWYNPQNGRFNRLDPYSGNQLSPLSFHKYAYANMNPVMGIDPSGLMTLGGIMITGAIIGGLAGAIGGVALSVYQGNDLYSLATLKSALVGLIGGAATGALVSGAIFLAPHGLYSIVINGFKAFLKKAAATHSKTPLGRVGGFFSGLICGILWPNFTAANILTAADIELIISQSMLQGAMVGTTSAPGRITLIRALGNTAREGLRWTNHWVQGTNFVAIGYLSGFVYGYWLGSIISAFLGDSNIDSDLVLENA